MMEGYSFEEDCEFVSSRTLVLVGNTGSGKSATGNSILGTQMFPIKRNLFAVTTTNCDLKTTTLEDGETLNVIDTPGLFDSSIDTKFIGKEVSNCMNMAKGGVDAFLVVISLRSRFSNVEKAAIDRLITLFGRKICDYMILVFTGGDGLEDENQSLEDYLHDSPKTLQETLELCGNRCVLFNNRTKDPTKRTNQLQKLLSLVNMVSKNNEGKPYTKEMFTEPEKCTQELDEQYILVSDEQFKRINEMVESKLKETTLRLEQQLAEERTARLNAEKYAKFAQKTSQEEIKRVELNFKDKTLKLEQLLAKERSARLMTDEIVDVTQKISAKEMMNVNSKLKDQTLMLKQLLTEERRKAEENLRIAQKNSDDDMKKVASTLNGMILRLEARYEEVLTAQNKSDEEMKKIELKLKETTLKLEQLLPKAEENVKSAQMKSDKEIQKEGDPNEQTIGYIVDQLRGLKIQKEGDPNEQTIGYTVDQLRRLIFSYKQAATSIHPKYQHIDFSEKQKVLKVCSEAENWLREKTQMHVSPNYRKKAWEIDRVCRPIMSKPKPAPPK